MAYSGLGAGTYADPYQITTIAQFREMYTTSSGIVSFYKLMNDLDWKNEEHFGAESFTGTSSQQYFMGVLYGNSKKLTNLPTKGIAFPLSLNSTVRIYELEMRYKSPIKGNPYLFYSASGEYSNVTIDHLKVVVEPGTSPLRSYGRFSSASSLSNLEFEGEFADCILGRTAGFISRIVINNHYIGSCRVADLNTGSILELFRYYKPYTRITEFDTNNLYMPFCAIAYGTTTIRNGFLSLGNINVVPTSTEQHGSLMFNNASGGLVATVEDCYIVADMTYNSQVLFCDRIARSTGLDVFSRVHFFGNLNEGTNEQRTSVFGNGIYEDCFYNKELQGGTFDVTGQTGLDTYEFIDNSVWTGFDFDTIWQMGSKYPILTDSPEDYDLEYAAELIVVDITDMSITLTPHLNRYSGQFGFDVVKISDGSVVATVADYTTPYVFDPSTYGGIQVLAFILDGSNKWYCGGDFFLDYSAAAAPEIQANNPAVAYLMFTQPENLGGGTFAGFLVEKKTDATNWVLIANNYLAEDLFHVITEKTYFRASAITIEYGVGEVSSQVIVTPKVGGDITQPIPYRIYLGKQEVSLR